MKRYEPTTPRATFGLSAAAMTAFTIALAVIAPARMDVSAQQERFSTLAPAAVTASDDGAVRTKTQS